MDEVDAEDEADQPDNEVDGKENDGTDEGVGHPFLGFLDGFLVATGGNVFIGAKKKHHNQDQPAQAQGDGHKVGDECLHGRGGGKEG